MNIRVVRIVYEYSEISLVQYISEVRLEASELRKVKVSGLSYTCTYVDIVLDVG